MELRQLSTFIQVAQLKSFSRAAESLGYSQSAVTVQIRQLEEELDTRLFDRIGKHISLTTRGVQFLEHAYDVLQEVNKARLSVSDTGELHGRLHIGTIESLCFSKLPAALHAYWQRHPKVVVHVTTGEPKFLIERMERGELDLIYILDEPRYSNNWNKLMERKERVVFVTSASLGAERGGHSGADRGGPAGQAVLSHGAGHQLPPGAGPLPGRPEQESHPLPGVQRHVFSHPHPGEQPGRLPAALVCGGAERGAGEALLDPGSGFSCHAVPADLFPQGEVVLPGDGRVCPCGQ